jgi:PAS domain S-box-containing protein
MACRKEAASAPLEQRSEASQMLDRVGRGETLPTFESRPLRKDGTSMAVPRSIEPIRGAEGSVVGASKVAREPSTHADSAARWRIALEAAGAGTWEAWPLEGRFAADARARQLHGIAADASLTNDEALAAIHPDDRANLERALQATLEHGIPFRSEHRVCWPDGTVHWVLTQAQVFDRDSSPHLVGLVQDITSRKMEQNSLRIVGESFRQLVEQSPFGIYAVDADFRLAIVSAGAQKVFATVRPLLGRDFDEVLRTLWPEPFVSEALARFRHTLATGEPYHAPSTVERRADTAAIEAYDWKLERMVLPDERPGVVCHFYDLSERQRHEEALRVARSRLEAALDASQVVLFQQDRDLRYTWIRNPAFGSTPESVVGARDGALFERTEDAARTEALKRSVMATGVAQREEVCIVRDGVPHYYDLVVQPDRDAGGEVVGVLCAAIDTTARKAIEEELRKADRQKNDFLAMLAHELRNPLAPIRNASTFLARKLPDDPSVQAPLAMIARQTTQLTRLVDDLLDVSRIAEGRIELQAETLEVGAIVDQATESAQPLITAKRHRLRIHRRPEGLYVRGDRARLVQAVSNLLQNAAKYTDPAGSITVELGASEAWLDIVVRDSGIGIPDDLLPKVFDLFVQGERTLDRSQGGLGIGLSVVRKLVEMHGGSVRASSAGLGSGASFSIRLPRVAAPVVAVASPAAPPPFTRRRVLVVDDNVDAADALCALLTLEGHDVQAVYSAPAALAAIEAHEPDCVLLDIGMPLVDGYALARQICTRSGVRRMRLIAVTGYGQPADRASAAAAGFDAHLVKPVDLDSLNRLLSISEPSPAP